MKITFKLNAKQIHQFLLLASIAQKEEQLAINEVQGTRNPVRYSGFTGFIDSEIAALTDSMFDPMMRGQRWILKRKTGLLTYVGSRHVLQMGYSREVVEELDFRGWSQIVEYTTTEPEWHWLETRDDQSEGWVPEQDHDYLVGLQLLAA